MARSANVQKVILSDDYSENNSISGDQEMDIMKNIYVRVLIKSASNEEEDINNSISISKSLTDEEYI